MLVLIMIKKIKIAFCLGFSFKEKERVRGLMSSKLFKYSKSR